MAVYETESRQNVSIMGTGSSAGGVLGKVKINGDGRIHGNGDCLSFHCNGSAVVGGSLRCREGRVNGQLRVDDHLDAERMKINGGLQIGGSGRIGQLHMNGDISIGSSLSVVKMTIFGTLEASEEIGTENMTVRGRIKIGKALYGREINMKLHGKGSKVKRITGESITVSVSRLTKLMGSPREGILNAEYIEGDHIFLEHTKADTVRGRRVTIGRGCVIGQVEYSEDLKTDKDAEVINVVRY